MPFTVRSTVRKMAAYVSGEAAGDMIQLGFNESAFPPSPKAIEAARRACHDTRRYNDENYSALKRALADHHGLDEDRIVCGAGSMDIMRDLAACCLEPGRTLVTGRLSYAFPAVLARAAGAEARLVEEPSFTHDVDAFTDAVTGNCAILYIASPNNPTGTSVDLAALRRLAEALPDHVLLMIDAAYADYVTTPPASSADVLVDEGYNAAVLHTFSKAHGLAGLRTGWAYAGRHVVEAVAKVRLPGVLSMPAMAAAIASLADTGHTTQVVQQTCALRERMTARLVELGLDVIPGDGNFLMAGLPQSFTMDAETLYQRVKARGILLRRLANFGLERHLRITIGPSDDMAALDRVLTEVLADA